MKNKKVFAIVGALLLILLLVTARYPEYMISPGKTIDAHAEIARDCFACHMPFLGSTPEKCTTCHKVADIGLRTTGGVAIGAEDKLVAFHQKLLEQDCVACHSDHRGVQAFRPIRQFSHELLEPALAQQCSSCHSGPDDALHRNRKGSCATCHTTERWRPASFDHDRYFRFDRNHTTECATCHIDDDYDRFTCYGCHEHSRSRIREEHVEEGILNYENCAECHRSGDEDGAEALWRKRRMKSGPLESGDRNGDRRRHEDDDDEDD